jgi:hypothetical protein
VPVFRSVLSRRALLRVAVALHSLFLWVPLLVGGLRRRRPGFEAVAEAGAGPGTTTWRARRREQRQAAEEVAMAEDSTAEEQGARSATFLVVGARRNALFCRLWAPAAKEMR